MGARAPALAVTDHLDGWRNVGAGELRDVIVVGAGPAGSSAAARLAAAGHDVLLLDRHECPREKACGDGLIADALAALRRAGVYQRVAAEATSASAARAFSPGGHTVRVDAPLLTLRRERLDQILVEEAVRQGARLRTARVTALRPQGEAVALELAGAAPSLRARFVVVACGADLALLRPLGAVLQPEPDGVAIRRYLTSDAPPLEELVFAYQRDIVPGYAWIFPLGAGAYNVGVGVFFRRPGNRALDVRRVLERFLGTFPLARTLMASATELGPVRGARLRMGLAAVRPVTGRVLAAGDSVAAILPLSAEGIGKALETGWLAAGAVDEALRSGDPAAAGAYAAAIARLRAGYAGYARAARWLARPWAVDLLVRRGARSEWLRRGIAGIIQDTTDPATVFSGRALLRSLVG